jgi:putative transposase
VGPVGEIINKTERPNHVWSYDFVEDRTGCGGKLRILVIIDEYTQKCLATRVEPSILSAVVIEVLEWLFLTRGVPKYLRSDNGPEFVAKAVCNWLAESACQALFITPGSPWENGYIESFNDKLRDECLNREVFRNGKETQIIVEVWKQEYNNHRPHNSLVYLTPAEFARRYYEKNQITDVKQPVEKVTFSPKTVPAKVRFLWDNHTLRGGLYHEEFKVHAGAGSLRHAAV